MLLNLSSRLNVYVHRDVHLIIPDNCSLFFNPVHDNRFSHVTQALNFCLDAEPGCQKLPELL